MTNFWVQFLAGICVAGVGIYGAGRWFTQHIATIANDQSGVDDLMRELDTVKAQLRNNGGSSLKDAIDRIERAVGEVRVDVAKLDRAFARHQGLHEGLDL